MQKVLEAVDFTLGKERDFTKSSIYKNSVKQAKQLFFYAEDDPFYRKNVFEPDPVAAYLDEIDQYEYAVNMISAINPTDKEIRIEFFNILRDAKERLRKAQQKVQKPYFQDPESDKFKDNVKPNFYNKLALELYTKVYTLFGLDWDFIWPWYYTRNDPTKSIIRKNAQLKKMGVNIDPEYTQEYDIKEARALVLKESTRALLHKEFEAIRLSCNLSESFSGQQLSKKINAAYMKVLGY